jgi:transcriptional regulator with XRE-family HTH domain
MLSETLTEGLENYRIGPKIRTLRNSKGLGLAELGGHTGLSAGMLSKIERGSVFPTLPTLLRISLVFAVGLDHFFTDNEDPVLEIVRSKDRIRLPNVTDTKPTFLFESLDFPVNDRKMEAFLAEFQPRSPQTEPHEHAGPEMIFVISGALEIEIHNVKHELSTGDSLYFESEYPHSYRTLGQDRCKVIAVTVNQRTK